jgi:hypothetical protein
MSSTLTTNYKQLMTFFFYIYLQGLTTMFLNLHTRLYEKSCRLKKKDDDYIVDKVPCLKIRWLLPVNLPFYFLYRALLIEVLLSVAKILLKFIVIQINVHSAYRVTLRYWSSTGPDFIHWWKLTRECCNSRLINCVVVRLHYKCISGLPSFLWPRFPI